MHFNLKFSDPEQEALAYIENKRPVVPVKYNQENYDTNLRVQHSDVPLEHIDLCSSDSEIDEMVFCLAYIYM